MLLLLSILIVGKCIYNAYLSMFSFSHVSGEYNTDDNQSWNMKYLITNKGGELTA